MPPRTCFIRQLQRFLRPSMSIMAIQLFVVLPKNLKSPSWKKRCKYFMMNKIKLNLTKNKKVEGQVNQ